MKVMSIHEQVLEILYLAHFVKGKSIAQISEESDLSKSFIYKLRKEVIDSNNYYIPN